MKSFYWWSERIVKMQGEKEDQRTELDRNVQTALPKLSA